VIRLILLARPLTLKDKKKWAKWEPPFVNYLSTIQGVNGVPLSYDIVRDENEESEVDREFESFSKRSVACSLLSGVVFFQADARKVHQLLKSFLQAEMVEQWIKPLAKRQNRRADMIALRNQYSGEQGNTSRRIAAAEKLRDTFTTRTKGLFHFRHS
jgi:hypothetical protein